MRRPAFRPRLEALDARLAPSGLIAPATSIVVPVASLPPVNPVQGYSPGLGGSPGGSRDRGAPPGVIGDWRGR